MSIGQTINTGNAVAYLKRGPNFFKFFYILKTCKLLPQDRGYFSWFNSCHK